MLRKQICLIKIILDLYNIVKCFKASNLKIKIKWSTIKKY
jgi:hypothetical protein